MILQRQLSTNTSIRTEFIIASLKNYPTFELLSIRMAVIRRAALPFPRVLVGYSGWNLIDGAIVHSLCIDDMNGDTCRNWNVGLIVRIL